MANNPALYLRRAVLLRLNADADRPAWLPAARLYPEFPPGDPVWPWAYMGAPIATEFVAAGMDGEALAFDWHGFAGTTGAGAATLPGAQAAGEIAAWCKGALDGAAIDLATEALCPYPATAHIAWQRSQVFRDGGGALGSFHSVAAFVAAIAS